GAWDEFTEGRTSREWLEQVYQRFRARVAERGVDVPPFDEFWAQGETHLPVDSDDHTLFDRFRADPDEHRLATPRRSPASATTTAPAIPRGSSRSSGSARRARQPSRSIWWRTSRARACTAS